MLSLAKFYFIRHEIVFLISSISHHLRRPTSFPIILSAAILHFYILEWWGGVVLLVPLRTPVSSVMFILLTWFAGAAPSNTNSNTIPGGVTVLVLPMKVVIIPRVPTLLASIGSPSTASFEIPYPCWVQMI